MAGWLDKFKLWRRKVSQDQSSDTYIDIEPETSSGPAPQASEGWLTRLRGPTRKEQQINALQQGFQELVGLTRSIREHMDQQVATQKTLVDLLRHMPDAVEGLKSVGKVTEQQSETLALLKKQLESNVRHDEQMMESIKRFNDTLSLMDKTSQGTAQTVATLADRTRESEDLLREILARSEKRLVYLISTLVVITIAVLGFGFYFGTGGWPLDRGSSEPAAAAPFEHKKSITELNDKPAPVPEETATVEEPAADAPEEPADAAAEEDEVSAPEEPEEPEEKPAPKPRAKRTR